MGKVDKNQLQWGVVLGVITFGMMVASYKVGFGRGENVENQENGEILAESIEINPKEVYVYIRENCDDFELTKEDVREYCVTFKEEMRAFSAMEELEENDDSFSFEYEESDFGAFITGVNNYNAEKDVEFWSFLVNGEMSMVGVSDYVVMQGDELGFVVEEISM